MTKGCELLVRLPMFIARNDRTGSRSEILHHCILRQWKITGTAKVIFHVLKFLENGIETCMNANSVEISVWLARLKKHNRYSVCVRSRWKHKSSLHELTTCITKISLRFSPVFFLIYGWMIFVSSLSITNSEAY